MSIKLFIDTAADPAVQHPDRQVTPSTRPVGEWLRDGLRRLTRLWPAAARGHGPETARPRK